MASSGRTDKSAAVVVGVAPGSAAEKAGLRAGDVVGAIDGQDIKDIIDYHLATDRAKVSIAYRRGGSRAVAIAAKGEHEDLGLRFKGPVFDGIATCRNACVFCFVDQLPKGLRQSLYVKDDDYRLSFLYGNFISLTNLGDEDIERIVSRRLTPLYVSVHATEPAVRKALLRPRGPDTAMGGLRRLIDGGIEIQTQVVLCPDINDGDVLDQTLADLYAMGEKIASVGVVPLGTTAHRGGLPRLRAVDRAVARRTIGSLDGWRKKARRDRSVGWAYAADELYLSFGEAPPPVSYYDDYPQLENGIGMARLFLDESGRRKKVTKAANRTQLTRSENDDGDGDVIAVTGTLSFPVVRSGLEAAGLGKRIRLLPVRNRWLGVQVSVTGLLSGGDILAAVTGGAAGAATGQARRGTARRLLVPDVCLNEGVFLDGMTAAELAQATDMEMSIVPSRAGAFLKWARKGLK